MIPPSIFELIFSQTLQSAFIHTEQSAIHYYRFGTGARWLFCFHGYGEEGTSFAFLEKELGARFTIISIEMPFHGKTNWKGPLLFEPESLINIIHQIKPPHISMYLLGYSMGGRVVMQLMQLIPSEIGKIILIAPDGLPKNLWQKISTQTWLGNKLFLYCMRHPGLIVGTMDLLGKMNLFNRSIIKFVHYYLDDAASRNLLYKCWSTMRHFRSDKVKLANICRETQIPISMLFGKYDRVIIDKHGKSFAAMAPDLIRLQTIEAGHQLLKPKFATLIAGLILDQ